MKRNSTQQKMKAYAAMAGSLLLAGPVRSQVIYTNIDPDVELNVSLTGEEYFLDLNNDGENDFRIFALSGSSSINEIMVSPLSADKSIAGYDFVFTSSDLVWPNVKHSPSMIDSALLWYNNAHPVQTMGRRFFNSSGSSTFSGKWIHAVDGYLALRVHTASGYIYGWARLDVADDCSSATIKDYAYNINVGEGICAGDVVGSATDCASIISASQWGTVADIADANNGSDLQFTFNAPLAETGIEEYRVIAVKISAAGSFGISAATGLSSALYIPVVPNGSASYSGVFTAISKDSEADPIQNGQPYQLFVLSKAVSGFDHNLSEPSPEITLTSPLGIDLTPQNIIRVYAENNQLIFNTGIELKNTTVSIYAATGALIKTFEGSISDGYAIDISVLSGGIYFISIQSETAKFISRFFR